MIGRHRVQSCEAPLRVVRPQPDRRRSIRLATAPLLALAVMLGALLPPPAAGTATWSRNVWVSSAFLYQDPYYTACTAASTMMMLNTIAYRGAGGNGFRWTPYRVRSNRTDPRDYRDMTSILEFSRRYDTLRSTSAGTDAHGWRNALNSYGWGRAAMADPSLRSYEDRAYRSFDAAVKAAVRAIARFGMPVGVLAWAGGHAQVMTGYVVTGEDPSTSSDFTVRYVYLSDPLRESAVVNRKTSYDQFRGGSLRVRFQWYRETDSPYDDPYASGTIRSAVKPTVASSEWYHRWVLVLPVRQGIPAAPPPDPTPTPDPSASPTAEPPADPSPAPDSTAGATASADPTSLPEVAPTTSAQPAVEPSVTPSAEPSSMPSGDPPPP